MHISLQFLAKLEAKLVRMAAARGDAEAQNNLGVMYASGRGVPQDLAEAVRWYRRAAEQGHGYAQFNLGRMYLDGAGVPQDHAEAVKWYRMAVEQGQGHAQRGRGGRGPGSTTAGHGPVRSYAGSTSRRRGVAGTRPISSTSSAAG
jgi:TPR repeat protein